MIAAQHAECILSVIAGFSDRLRRQVRLATVCFDPESVYGTRSGFHQALLCVANDKANIFLKSQFWKTGVASGATMLGRGEMLKLPREGKAFGGEGRFTRVQEMKQASRHKHALQFRKDLHVVQSKGLATNPSQSFGT